MRTEAELAIMPLMDKKQRRAIAGQVKRSETNAFGSCRPDGSSSAPEFGLGSCQRILQSIDAMSSISARSMTE
jgi:hypothetical protein